MCTVVVVVSGTVVGGTVVGGAVGLALGLTGQAAAAGPAAGAGGWTVAQTYLWYYHHYANFTPAQCRLLPSEYVRGCLFGAERQAEDPAVSHDSISERESLFYEYQHGAGFSYMGCALLPTDSVEECEARFPARATLPAHLTCADTSDTLCILQPSTPVVNGLAQKYLAKYHDYADLTDAECRQLPAVYVQGCLYGAAQQARNARAVGAETLARRKALFWEYTHNTGFSRMGCTLLPTDTVEGCQERFPD